MDVGVEWFVFMMNGRETSVAGCVTQDAASEKTSVNAKLYCGAIGTLVDVNCAGERCKPEGRYKLI